MTSYLKYRDNEKYRSRSRSPDYHKKRDEKYNNKCQRDRSRSRSPSSEEEYKKYRKHYHKKRYNNGIADHDKWRDERERIAEYGIDYIWGLSPEAPNYESEEDLNKTLETNESESDNGKKKTKKSRKKKQKQKEKKKKKKKKKHKKKYSSGSGESDDGADDTANRQGEKNKPDDEWTEKPNSENLAVGPMPVSIAEVQGTTAKDYGHALLPGEGEAMAQFVKEGKRIPRRGEIGLTSDEIQSFEDAGYVMSGSRHRRMEAVRLRKENQVYSADEKRALAMYNREEKAKRENKILADFRELVQTKKNKK